MPMRNAGVWLAAVSLLGSAAGFAADPQVEAGRQCAQLKDSLQRLVCYDRIFLTGDPAASAAVSAPRVAVPAPIPALGDEAVQRRSKEAKPAEPADLEAKITALKETRPNVVRLTLDNGQTWQQMDMSSVFQVSVGDTVRIEKGTMGGYRLTRTSRGRSGWIRVTRVQ
jgi:hypothetical protein